MKDFFSGNGFANFLFTNNSLSLLIVIRFRTKISCFSWIREITFPILAKIAYFKKMLKINNFMGNSRLSFLKKISKFAFDSSYVFVEKNKIIFFIPKVKTPYLNHANIRTHCTKHTCHFDSPFCLMAEITIWLVVWHPPKRATKLWPFTYTPKLFHTNVAQYHTCLVLHPKELDLLIEVTYRCCKRIFCTERLIFNRSLNNFNYIYSYLVTWLSTTV